MASDPKNPARAKAMRTLHRLAAERGITHEDLRPIVGVQQSLTDATLAQLLDAIRRMRDDRPTKRIRRRPVNRGTILAATPRQRDYIRDLLLKPENLGWSVEQAAKWLKDQGVSYDNLSSAALTAGDAHRLVRVLLSIRDNVRRRREAAAATEGHV